MSAQIKINSNDLEEYLAVLAHYTGVPSDDDKKMKELIRSYAELKFKMVGGSRCSMCRAHVRHVVAVTAEFANGEVRHHDCLCTRCFEGEKGAAEHVYLEMGENRMEVKLRHRDEELKVKHSHKTQKANA